MRILPWPARKPKADRKASPHRGLVMRARFDAAETTPDNRRHWAGADGLAPNAALSAEVRRTLRNRARYETANNAYARGIVLTLANDVVGTGPSLQMLADDPAGNRRTEEAFHAWAEAIGLAQKLRTMRMARADSGEAFALLFSNPAVGHPVQLDLRLVEADQIAGSATDLSDPAAPVDGIVFDALGNPVEYHVLRDHPGDTSFDVDPDAFDRWPAASVVHYFRPDRPGQARGVPDITPALPLFAQLRRYTLAVIAAAESAANIAILMKTNAPASGEAAEVEPMTEMEFVPNMAVFTPEGWEPSQVRAEQPTTTYDMFKREILNEIARCLNMPFNVAAGNSSGYNYASGRLDHQTYFKSIRVEQAHLESVVLDRVLSAWIDEASKIEGLLPQSMRAVNPAFPHQWFWDGHEHVDPAKEASAQASRLNSHTTTLAAEYARQGKDWEAELRQRAREVALARELGLATAAASPPPQPPESPEAPESPESPDPSEGTDDRDESESRSAA